MHKKGYYQDASVYHCLYEGHFDTNLFEGQGEMASYVDITNVAEMTDATVKFENTNGKMITRELFMSEILIQDLYDGGFPITFLELIYKYGKVTDFNRIHNKSLDFSINLFEYYLQYNQEFFNSRIRKKKIGMRGKSIYNFDVAYYHVRTAE